MRPAPHSGRIVRHRLRQRRRAKSAKSSPGLANCAVPLRAVHPRLPRVTAPPHLFARPLYPELSVLQHGARDVLKRHASVMVVLHFPADRLLDIDTLDDYERAKARVARSSAAG